MSHIEQVSSSKPVVDTVETLAALREVSEVRDAVVIERVGADGRAVLLGYVVGPDPKDGTAGILRQLMTMLPDYLIPKFLLIVEEIPQTPDGDYDLAALPEPDGDSSVDGYVAPGTPTELQLVEFMLEFVDPQRVGIHDSFFALGGSSFLATRLANRIRETYAVELTLRDVFAFPTVDGLATLIARAQGELPAEKRRRRARERALWFVAAHPAVLWARRRVGRLPLVRRGLR